MTPREWAEWALNRHFGLTTRELHPIVFAEYQDGSVGIGLAIQLAIQGAVKAAIQEERERLLDQINSFVNTKTPKSHE